MVKANSKLQRICAFCVHWYAPANSHIAPCKPYDGIHWEIDEKAESPCFKKMMETKADHSCLHFELKKLI